MTLSPNCLCEARTHELPSYAAGATTVHIHVYCDAMQHCMQSCQVLWCNAHSPQCTARAAALQPHTACSPGQTCWRAAGNGYAARTCIGMRPYVFAQGPRGAGVLLAAASVPNMLAEVAFAAEHANVLLPNSYTYRHTCIDQHLMSLLACSCALQMPAQPGALPCPAQPTAKPVLSA